MNRLLNLGRSVTGRSQLGVPRFKNAIRFEGDLEMPPDPFLSPSPAPAPISDHPHTSGGDGMNLQLTPQSETRTVAMSILSMQENMDMT